MKVLGISGLYHDSAAALCIDGEIAAAAQEERFTRVKGDARYPIQSIDYCLQAAGGLAPAELDAVVYYDHPMLTYSRWLSGILNLGENSGEMVDLSFDSLFKQKLWIHKLVDNHLGIPGKHGKLWVTKHHIAHAASAFYPSPFEEAAIVTADGVGEWATTTIGVGEGSSVELINEIDYPHSIGLLYSAFTYYCGFKVNSGEYKLMGLAPYGEAKYAGVIRRELIDIKPDGSYRLNMDYFSFDRGRIMINERFCALFEGGARKPESMITKREMDLAASIQRVTEEVVIRLAEHAKEVTGKRYLCLAGGIALNCVASGKLLRKGLFDDIWIQPAAGDAGGALGAALYASHAQFGVKRAVRKRGSQKGSYLGPKFDTHDVTSCLKAEGAAFDVVPDKTDLYAKAARLLEEGKVVGFFNGRMEFGPRALGARSILGDPRNLDMQVKLNLKIKFRESFRPFAPAVLAEKASEYFDIDRESPYMLLCADVVEDRQLPFSMSEFLKDVGGNDELDLLPIVKIPRSDIPAVTHVDYSARLQTVNAEDNPDFHALLTEFYKLTGCPVLVNTSFNVRGEPIVCSPKEAYDCFMKTDMDALIMENVLLIKESQPEHTRERVGDITYELD